MKRDKIDPDTMFILGIVKALQNRGVKEYKLSEVVEPTGKVVDFKTPIEKCLVTTVDGFKRMPEIEKYNNRPTMFAMEVEKRVEVNYFYKKTINRGEICLGAIKEEGDYFVCYNDIFDTGYVNKSNTVLKAINGHSAKVIQWCMNYDDYVVKQCKLEKNHGFGYMRIPLDKITIRLPLPYEQKRIEKALILYEDKIRLEAEYIEQLKKIKNTMQEKMFC